MSVILAVLNAEATIAEQLDALARQLRPPTWELLVVDNGCTDGTLDIVESRRDQFPRLRIVDAHVKRGLAHARNVGVAASEAEVVAFCDGDDVVGSSWLAALAVGCRSADLVGGSLEVSLLNTPDAVYWRGESPTSSGLPLALGYLPTVVGANFAVRRALYHAVGGCDERFSICCDDVDLSWRLHRAGATVAYAPTAVVHYRYRNDIADAVRQQRNYGRTEGLLVRLHRPGVRRDSLGTVLRVYWYLLSRCHHRGRDPYRAGRWRSVAAYRTGRIQGGWEHRVLWW